MSELVHKEITGAGASQFGYFGEDPRYNEHVAAYRDAMVADGWSIEPTYRHEPVESAARLVREGFVCQILTRDKGASETREPRDRGLKRYEASLSMWGPDRLALRPPYPYSFAACEARTRTCHDCGKSDVPTERVGFAGRVCADSLPAARKRVETPGWNS